MKIISLLKTVLKYFKFLRKLLCEISSVSGSGSKTDARFVSKYVWSAQMFEVLKYYSKEN